jgi:hypothetical protein
VVQGAGPGPRYGHVMSLVGQRFLLSISGNDGNYSTADTGLIFFEFFSLRLLLLMNLRDSGERNKL